MCPQMKCADSAKCRVASDLENTTEANLKLGSFILVSKRFGKCTDYSHLLTCLLIKNIIKTVLFWHITIYRYRRKLCNWILLQISLRKCFCRCSVQCSFKVATLRSSWRVSPNPWEVGWGGIIILYGGKQARKLWSYASLKLRPSNLLTESVELLA